MQFIVITINVYSYIVLVTYCELVLVLGGMEGMKRWRAPLISACRISTADRKCSKKCTIDNWPKTPFEKWI